jgi:hypothetical protein
VPQFIPRFDLKTPQIPVLNSLLLPIEHAA